VANRFECDRQERQRHHALKLAFHVPVSHSTSEDLERYIDGKLSAEDSAVIHTHLEQCEECQLRLGEIALQVQWTGPERRSEPRVPVSFPGRLKLLDPVTSVGPPHDALVIEISRSGLKIRTPRYLIPKTLVQIHFNGKAVLGQVKYCIRTDSGFDAGIKLVQDFPGTA
jgi:hypothetical protein